MGSTVKSLSAKYNLVPDTTAIEIFMQLGIIKSYTPPKVEDYSKGVSNSSSSSSTIDVDDLLGDGSADEKEVAAVARIANAAKVKINIHKGVNNKKDFIDRSDVDQSEVLAKFAVNDDFEGVRDFSKKYSGSYMLVTQTGKSYRIFIDMANIPHLLGLPNLDTIRNVLSTKLTNYLVKKGVNVKNYFDLLFKMFDDEKLKADWFNSLFVDLSNDKLIQHKDNTDKIGFKRACMQLFMDSINIGKIKFGSGGNKLMTYVSSDNKKLMSIVNIPNTDGYLGLICIFDPTINCYRLMSIVAYNESKLFDSLELEGSYFNLITDSILRLDTYNTNITNISISNSNSDSNSNSNSDSNSDIIKEQQARQALRSIIRSTDLIFGDDGYMGGKKKKAGFVKFYKDVLVGNANGNNTSNSNNNANVIMGADNKIREERNIIVEKILDAINNSEYNEQKLTKLLISLILISGIEYDEFLNNIFVILKNFNFNCCVLDLG